MTHQATDAGELSYFRLLLRSYLLDTHPDKARDEAFIAERGERGADAYSQAVQRGATPVEANEAAGAALFAGLHFSPYNTVTHILWDEFAAETDPATAHELAADLLPHLFGILSRYDLTDDFAEGPHYTQLYTELVGAIQTLLEDGLQ